MQTRRPPDASREASEEQAGALSQLGTEPSSRQRGPGPSDPATELGRPVLKFTSLTAASGGRHKCIKGLRCTAAAKRYPPGRIEDRMRRLGGQAQHLTPLVIGFPLAVNKVELAKNAHTITILFTCSHSQFNTYAGNQVGLHKLLIQLSGRDHKVGKVGNIHRVFLPARSRSRKLGPPPLSAVISRFPLLLLFISSCSTQHHPSTSLQHTRGSSRERLLPFYINHLHHLRASFATLSPATRHSELRTGRKFLHGHRPSFTSPQWLTRRPPQHQ